MVKLRLQRHGRKRLPYYHIVAADSRAARDGRIIETVGKFNPVVDNEHRVTLDTEKVLYWLGKGAQPSDTVRSILKIEGVFYRKHLKGWGKSDEEIEAEISAWKENKAGNAQPANTRAEKMKAQLKAEEEAVKKQEEEARIAAEAEAKAKEEEKAKAEAEAKAAEKAEAKEEPAEEAKADAEEAKETKEADSKEAKAETEEAPATEAAATEEAPAAEEKADDSEEEKK